MKLTLATVIGIVAALQFDVTQVQVAMGFTAFAVTCIIWGLTSNA